MLSYLPWFHIPSVFVNVLQSGSSISSVRIQAISGVSADAETIVATIYPSMAATAAGRLLGLLYDCIPIPINGIKLSHLLFPLPTSPIALLLYFYLKAFGSKYVVTNRAVRVWNSLGVRMRAQVALADIDDIAVTAAAGQRFFKAADLLLVSADGRLLLRLDGVPRAEVFRQTILEARDARLQNDRALATIKARQPA